MTNHAVSNRADLRERTKTMSRHGDRRGQIADFRDSFETINWLYLLFKCGIKTKTHFEWLLWHWSSLGQLNLEPTRPNGLVGCKVPTDLVKISVKEATHMGFHYRVIRQWFSRVTQSQVKTIAESLHEWPKIVIHGNPYVILFLTRSCSGYNPVKWWKLSSIHRSLAMGLYITVLWRHTSMYCDVILTDCPQNVSKDARVFPAVVNLIIIR